MVCIPLQEPPKIGIVLMTPPHTAIFVKVLHNQRLDWWHKTDCEILNDI